MNASASGSILDWIDNLKRLVGAPIASTLLDVIEPVAPVLAQGLWVAQPLAGLWNGGDASARIGGDARGTRRG